MSLVVRVELLAGRLGVGTLACHLLLVLTLQVLLLASNEDLIEDSRACAYIGRIVFNDLLLQAFCEIQSKSRRLRWSLEQGLVDGLVLGTAPIVLEAAVLLLLLRLVLLGLELLRMFQQDLVRLLTARGVAEPNMRLEQGRCGRQTRLRLLVQLLLGMRAHEVGLAAMTVLVWRVHCGGSLVVVWSAVGLLHRVLTQQLMVKLVL